jgi:hypothetical protein
MRLDVITHEGGRWRRELPRDLDSPQTTVFAFASPRFGRGPGPLRDLAAAFPRARIIGCSTAGEIHDTRVADDSVVAAVARFEATGIRSARTPIDGGVASYEAGVRLAAALAADDLRGVLVLSDGLRVNGSELVRGLNAVLPPGVVVTGGLAGDGERFASTWIFDGGEPLDGYAAAVGFYGDRVRLAHGSKGGWDIFGPERRVTRARGNVLFELDGKPALQLYKDYLGERAAGLPATALLFPLAVRAQAADEQVVRTILGVDEATQSLTFAGDVPEGSLAQLMRANFDRLVQGAGDAGTLARHDGDGPVLSIAISCVGRRLVLGERAEEETEATLDALPAGSRQVGFYSYGELSPLAAGACSLHNQTMTLTTFAER